MRRRGLKELPALLLALAGCGNSQVPPKVNGTTQGSHSWFPIASGVHAMGAPTLDGSMTCASCHLPDAPSFKQFTCVNCHNHEQAATDRLHTGLDKYAYASPQCLACHPSGAKAQFDHSGITGNCAQCHDVGGRFAALPVPGFTHPPTNSADCASCHNTTDWKTATGAPRGRSRVPNADVAVTALIPTYAGTTITSMTPRTEQLPMWMDHGSSDIAHAAMSACGNCHPNSSTGTFTPAYLHASLATLAKTDKTITQPKACASCHSDAAPSGFVGPNAANRSPASGAMKHDAVVWTNGKPTTTAIVSTECGLCHASGSGASNETWASTGNAGGVAAYHGPLAAAGLQQPSSCIDCHANSKPTATTSSSTATSAATDASTGIPAGTMAQFSHADVNVSGLDCNACHTDNGSSTKAGIQGKEWAQAKFHVNLVPPSRPLVLNATTGRCGNCHVAEKPGPAYTAYEHSALSNAPGTEDCASCHAFPGTGTATAPNWRGATGVPTSITVGGFPISQPPATTPTTQAGISSLPHPTVATGISCATCHGTGGGYKQAIGYDHKSTLSNTNCNACHEAGSNLVGIAWNGATSQASGAGDTRPASIIGLVPSTNGNGRALAQDYNHFYPADCGECHRAPAGNGLVTTGAAYRSAWRFDHNEGRIKRSTCNMCHGSPNNLPGD